VRDIRLERGAAQDLAGLVGGGGNERQAGGQAECRGRIGTPDSPCGCADGNFRRRAAMHFIRAAAFHR